MTSSSWIFANDPASRSAGSDLIKTHQERAALDEIERARQRRLDLDEQRSSLNSPEARIRIWEKLHGLRVPSALGHPILDVIAIATRLTLEEVQEEQRARLARSAQPKT